MLAHSQIRNDLTIIDLLHNETYTCDRIKNYTAYLKHEIYKKCNGNTLNKIIYVDTNDFFIVVCCMKASWELGASIFLNDVDPKIKELPYFKKFYSVIDLVVGVVSTNNWTDIEKYIFVDDRLTQSKQPLTFDLDIPAITPDTIAYYTTSSGTTGDPKILPFTHYQTVTISNEICQYLNIQESDVPFHYKSLHHGSLFNSFALPMLSTCTTHYYGLFPFQTEEFLTKIIDIAIAQKANYFLIPYNWIQNFNSIESTNLENQVTFITILGNSQNQMIDLFERFHPKQVINYFGCSEIGTMFISRTTKNNVSEYNPNKFSDIVSYIDYKILTNTVECKWKHVDFWYSLADKMEIINNHLWHYGRETVFVKNGQEIKLKELEEFLKKCLEIDQFMLVPDHLQQKLYLTFFQDNISLEKFSTVNINIQQKL